MSGYLVDLPGGPVRIVLNPRGLMVIAAQLAEIKLRAEAATAKRIEKRNKLMALRGKR